MSPIQCRLIVDSAHEGAWNMAVDEVLLASAAATSVWQLRVYGWQVPTLSLGYFQRYEERLAHGASRQAAVVRRASGGGAILHDHDVTYSLAFPARQGARDHRRLYGVVHEALARMLNSLGVPATLQGPMKDQPRQPPFLCFQRRAEGDILLRNAKIVGSAQRRSREAVLQHGSLLIAQSAAAPELPGLESLANVRLPSDDWQGLIAQAILTALGAGAEPAEMTADEAEQVQRLVAEKFGRPEWTRR
ncbi:MAG TPA: hypothetical protein VFI31_06935 [Pirellulales bacterium]|nr:hypothetical protein [Pirellulales bacterium]